MANSVFTGMGESQNQNLKHSFDFGKNISKNTGPKTPFPTFPDPSNQSKNMELEKCLIPNCPNQRLVYKGITYPVCGRKCWQRWQNQTKDASFWT